MFGTSSGDSQFSSFNVVFASAFREYHADLAAIFAPIGWTLHRAAGVRAAADLLQKHPVSVVICEDKLPDGNWEAVRDSLRGLSSTPCLIVSSRQSDENLWSEVLRGGGYGVLSIPFDPRTVRGMVRLACLRAQNRCRQETVQQAAAV
jgi:DNA-binding response OmpR family regulator